MATSMSTATATATPGRAADIVIDAVSVHFPSGPSTIAALENINLRVRENEFLCIMGPSGCGKTTILNVIAGFVPPSAGRVEIGGRRVTAPGPDRAVVFQNDAVFPWMTVEENIGYSPRVRGKSKQDVKAAVDRYVELVNLGEFRKAWPKQLSGGMKKRVDLARAYAADPDVLLLDEPFGALDIMTKEYLQAELLKIWLAAPRTIVFITHDLEEALFLGDRVVVMSPRPGRIKAIYEPGLPRSRDLSIKTDERFVALRRQVLETFAHGDVNAEEATHER